MGRISKKTASDLQCTCINLSWQHDVTFSTESSLAESNHLVLLPIKPVEMIAEYRHVGNLIPYFTVKSKSPAQQKPPSSSSHLLKRLWWRFSFFFFFYQAFRAGFLFKGSQESDYSPGEKLHNHWNNEPYAFPPMRVNRVHVFTQTYSITSTHSFIWVPRQMHTFHAAQCLKWSRSRDVRHVIPSCFHLPCPSQPHIVQKCQKEKKKTKPSHTN